MSSSIEHTNNNEKAFADLKAMSAELGIVLDDNVCSNLEKFCRELQSYNEHTNLVSNAQIDILVKEHILDSLTLVPMIEKYRPREGKISLIDIGSGAGFPGIILSIVLDKIDTTLVDSIGKKTNFLKQASATCNLQKRLKIINDRAEILIHSPKIRESFQIATARAVGNLRMITELVLPFLSVGGIFLVQKSKNQLEIEIKQAQDLISDLGGNMEEMLPANNQDTTQNRHIVVIKKVKTTPKHYPRSMSKIKQELKNKSI